MRSGASNGKRLLLGVCTLGVVGAVSASHVAEAHFILESPATWRSQDSLGLPEKLGPCGDEEDDGGASSPTGTVTAVVEGGKIKVTVNEVIFHPGHYRIAIAPSRDMLPAEPIVTPADTPCGSVPIQSPAVFPVLADGVFVHTAAFTAPQSIEVTLPAGLTCDKCTLQVIEFMGEHSLNVPGGCFYHHCADLSIQAAAKEDASSGVDAQGGGGGGGGGTGHPADAGSKGGDDAGDVDGSVSIGYAGGPGGGSSSSCGCEVGPRGMKGAWAALLGVAALVGRRRRRAR